jgi:carboxylesterase
VNDRGALLIHGFTATPECLDSLRAPLEEAGFVVEAPLLAGHGTKVSDLRHTQWRDWYESVLPAYHSLKKRTDAVCIAGLSLGGLLALKIAEEFKVQRLALLATPVLFKGFLMNRLLPLVANTPLHYLYPYQPKLLGPAIYDPEGRRAFRCYSWMPVEAIMEIVRLQDEVKPGLSGIKAPTVILHSPKDNTAPFENVAYLENRLGSKIIRAVKLEKSNHVLTMDYEKDLVAREVVRFFKA